MPTVPKPSKKKKSKRKKRSPRAILVNNLDALFSKIVRLSHAKNGAHYVSCVTCGKSLLVWWRDPEGKIRYEKGCEAGHYIKRGVYPLRWDKTNVHPQCTRCNHFMGGNESAHSKYIIDEHGLALHTWLHNRAAEYKAGTFPKQPIGELRDMEIEFKAELKELEGKL